MTTKVSRTPKSERQNRFRELDGLRGLAAIAVVLTHFRDATGLWNFLVYGVYGVQLFFLISGFVILLSANAAKRPVDFLISRVTRLYPTYWISLALATLIVVVAGLPVAHDPITVLLNTTMIQRWLLVDNIDSVYWTLAVELQFYALVGVLLWARRNKPAPLSPNFLSICAATWLGISLAVAVWASPVSQGVDPQLVPTFTKIVLNLSIAEYAPLFVGGAFLYISRSAGRIHPMAIVAWIASILTNWLIRDIEHALVVPTIFLLFSAVAMRERTHALLLRPLQWYGKISYSLYLNHSLLLVAIASTLVHCVGALPALAISLALVTAISWVVWRIGENSLSPAWRRRWSRRFS